MKRVVGTKTNKQRGRTDASQQDASQASRAHVAVRIYIYIYICTSINRTGAIVIGRERVHTHGHVRMEEIEERMRSKKNMERGTRPQALNTIDRLVSYSFFHTFPFFTLFPFQFFLSLARENRKRPAPRRRQPLKGSNKLRVPRHPNKRAQPHRKPRQLRGRHVV